MLGFFGNPGDLNGWYLPPALAEEVILLIPCVCVCVCLSALSRLWNIGHHISDGVVKYPKVQLMLVFLRHLERHSTEEIIFKISSDPPPPRWLMIVPLGPPAEAPLWFSETLPLKVILISGVKNPPPTKSKSKYTMYPWSLEAYLFMGPVHFCHRLV